ncbi:DUF3179 domain-containing (seleno)protein [Reichenbachiella sp.]|uniref:DUF3179 domain-containing (seleno)protein n=1 Tax=Reichenbachiella sp. TaxID=2184521 RepID=UPI003B59BADA
MMSRIYILLALVIWLSSCKESEQISPSDLTLVQGVINDDFSGEPVAIYANGINQTLVAFSRDHAEYGEPLTLSMSSDLAPAVLQDQFGNNYDINGKFLGSEGGNKFNLQKVNFLVGYWFFFPAFFENTILYNGQVVNSTKQTPSEGWLVNTDFIFTGSSRDGIPSIDNPTFVPLAGKEFVDDPFYSSLSQHDLMTVLKIGNTSHVYPHQILEYHEIVNDAIEGQNITLSYCPLTGTSRAWKSEVKNDFSEFGVSGLLYNNNLILYDRITESYWSQILELSINGDCLSEEISPIQVYETTFNGVKRLQGEVHLLSTNTGFNYIYNQSIYDDYRISDRVSFPISNQNNSLNPKERVLGIIKGGQVKTYSFGDFEDL